MATPPLSLPLLFPLERPSPFSTQRVMLPPLSEDRFVALLLLWGWLLNPRRQDDHYLTSAQTSFPASSWGLEHGQFQSPSVSSPGLAFGPEVVLTSHSPLSNDLFYLPTHSLSKSLVKREIKDCPFLFNSI